VAACGAGAAAGEAADHWVFGPKRGCSIVSARCFVERLRDVET
jgi:hypothetical protein